MAVEVGIGAELFDEVDPDRQGAGLAGADELAHGRVPVVEVAQAGEHVLAEQGRRAAGIEAEPVGGSWSPAGDVMVVSKDVGERTETIDDTVRKTEVEIDRADDEFEAFLLEVLSEWRVSFPEDGTTGTMRMDSKPGTRIAMGTTDKVIGYDVTYRFEGQDKTIRMDQKPGERLPVIDGQVEGFADEILAGECL